MMWKKVISTAVLAGMMATSLSFAGFADEQPILPIGVTALEQNETDLLPVRKIAEHFGYAVGWQEEGQIVSLTKGAQFITFTAGEDAYTFAKTAPESLGSPSVIVNDTTHVPVLFFTKLMGLNCHEMAENEYKVVLPNRAEITEIQEDGRLLVTDEVLGEVVVALTEETKLVANGKAVEKDVLAQGQAIMIEYGDAMTMSLPPQGTAVQITVLNLPVEEETEEIIEETVKVPFAGTITEIPETGRVLIETENDTVMLMISEETVITKGMDKRIYGVEDLTVGTKISGFHAEAMTMSLPPQTLALEIKIEEAEETEVTEEAIAFEGEITEIENELVTVTTENGAIRLVVSSETAITKGMEKRIYGLDDLTVGTKISGTHSSAMTRSLPPQAAALTIQIQ